MAKIAMAVLLLWGMAGGPPAKPSDTIGAIDFFGYAGLDVAKVRAALPVHAGDRLNDHAKELIEQAVTGVLGRGPTDVAEVCCDPQGRSLLYIGLPGESYKPFALNPAPSGAERLPQEIVKLDSRTGDALFAAVQKGDAGEDDSQGYTLANDLKLRSLQMQERRWALAHEEQLMKVLRSSSDAEQREIASEVLGYARRSDDQIAALQYAMRDPDSDVRNNATRALWVLVSADSELGAQLDPGRILEMLGSGKWTDHNKAVNLLAVMTSGRDPQLLAKIRAQALTPLIEMASWSEQGHAAGARIVLGRIAGIPEDKLEDLAMHGPPDAMFNALHTQ